MNNQDKSVLADLMRSLEAAHASLSEAELKITFTSESEKKVLDQIGTTKLAVVGLYSKLQLYR